MNSTESPDWFVKTVLSYCGERFPLAAYTLLVGFFFWSAMIVYSLDASRSVAWLGGGVMWLVFFHLRVFDEFKDYHQDRWTHPDRLLSRGYISLSFLGRLGLAAIVVEALLSFVIGSSALVFWLVVLGFSLLMRFEFGVGQRLEKNMLLYAVTHNPIVACLAIFAWGCSAEPWQDRNLWYVLSVSIASLAFEMARKTNQPQEEVDGVDSYSSVYGLSRVLWMIRALVFLGGICTGRVLLALGSSIWGWGILVFGMSISVFLTLPKGSAKHFELSGTLFLLLSMLAMIVAPW